MNNLDPKSYLQRQNPGEFRLVLSGNQTYYIHPLGRDGETFDGNLKENNWISVKERLPEQGRWCLVYSWRGVFMASFWGTTWAIFNWNNPGLRIEFNDVSHWQPRPEPPKSETV